MQKMWNASRFCVSSLRFALDIGLCIIGTLEYWNIGTQLEHNWNKSEQFRRATVRGLKISSYFDFFNHLSCSKYTGSFIRTLVVQDSLDLV